MKKTLIVLAVIASLATLVTGTKKAFRLTKERDEKFQMARIEGRTVFVTNVTRHTALCGRHALKPFSGPCFLCKRKLRTNVTEVIAK